MPDITPILPQGALRITRYGPEGFTVRDRLYAGSILITPSAVLPWEAGFAPCAFEALRPCAGEVDLVLIGMGAAFARLPRDAEAFLRGLGMIPNAMDTGAACRTYNVLLSEGRQIAAALMSIS